MPIRRSTLPGLCALLLAHAALAQTCGQWVTGIGPGGTGGGISGADNTIMSMATWDRSALGLPSLAVITGYFGVVGDQDVSPLRNGYTSCAVAWDGQHWSDLPSAEPTQESALLALGTYQSHLICGLSVTSGWQIISFDGTAWSPLGEPIATPTHTPLVMTALGTDMFIGGTFTQVGSLSVSNIVRWDGAAWHAMGSGLSGGAVSAAAIYQGQLIAGGAFTSSGATSLPHIAVWDGTSWSALGIGNPYGCRALASVGGLLYELDIWLRVWDGNSWTFLAETTGQPFLSMARAMTVHDGSLFVIGGFGDQFPVDSGSGSTRVGRWTGNAWELSDPVLASTGNLGFVSTGNELLATPLNDGLDPDTFPIVRPVRRWDGTTWRPAGDGFDAPVQIVRKIGSGGYMAAGLFAGAGSSLANGVAIWNGTTWAPMDAGLPPPLNGAHQWSIYDAIMFQGEPILAGTFTSVGGDSRVRGVVGWNGDSWGPLGQPGVIQGSGAGLTLYQGKLAAAIRQDAQDTATIWLFDGTDWAQIPGVLAGFPQVAAGWFVAGSPIKMVEFQGNLIVTGAFTSVAGIPAQEYAKWDGASWSAINTGGLSAPSALAVHAGALYAANGPVWRWDGASWTQVPSSAHLGLEINSLLSHAGELWAGTNNGVVRFDGIAWRQAGVGQTWPGPYALEEDGDDVLVGGGFISVGDRLAVAELARWSHVPSPLSVTPSAASAAAPTLQSTLVPFALSGAAPYSDFRLIRNGVDLHAPPWPTPGRSFSVNGLGFMIDNPLPTDGGDYQIAATNPCGSTISTPVHVTVTCTADFDGNGRVDVQDLLDFIGAWLAGDPRTNFHDTSSPTGGTLDIWRFLGAWFSGC